MSDKNMILIHRLAIRGFMIGTLELKAAVGLFSVNNYLAFAL
jgi:hypothetical protein